MSQHSPEPEAELQLPKIICPHCRQEYDPPGPNFCQYCGFPIQGPGPGDRAIRSVEPAQEQDAPHQELVLPPGEPPRRPAESSRPRQVPDIPQPRRGNRRAWRFFFIIPGAVILAVILFVGGKWILENLLPASDGEPDQPQACTPFQPDDGYEGANRHDLQGELLRDSYFEAGEAYAIAENAAFIIPAGVTLLIEPGAQVKFGPGAKMVVHGTLLACGRASRQILFTADTTTGRPGYWAGLEFQDADPDSVLGHATIKFGGKDGHAPLWIENSDLHVEDLLFDSNAWYALSLDPDSQPRVRRPVEVENGLLGWEIRAGELSGNKVWSARQPYAVNGEIDVVENASLSIEPGAVVRFQHNSALNIHGELEAVGTSGDGIVLTSVNDREDGDAVEPQEGDWIGLRIVGQKSNATLENVEIRFGGAEGKSSACLYLQEASPRLRSIKLIHCARFALSTDIVSQPDLEKLTVDSDEITRRWELRGSTLNGVNQRAIPAWNTTDRRPLWPIVTGWVVIEEEAGLEIPAGAVMLFANGGDAGLYTKGTLQVAGTRRTPVIFTSYRDPQYNNEAGAVPADWSGVHFENVAAGDAALTQAEVRFAGAGSSGCVTFKKSDVETNALTVRDCSVYPVASDAASQPVFEGLDISENENANLWEIWESALEEKSEWVWEPVQDRNRRAVIRRITGVINVKKEATLRLAPGLVATFSDGKGIVVREGVLLSEGAENEPVVLTSWRDPEVVDTGEVPQPGDWGGIVLDGSSKSQIRNTMLLYAGQPQNGVGCINLSASSPTIQNLTISNCEYYPVTSDLGSNPVVEGLAFTANQPTNDWAIRESSLQKGNDLTWLPLQQAENKESIQRVVTGRLTIDEGAVLSIAEGVVVKFRPDVRLNVAGTLDVGGTNSVPVILTSWRDPEFSQEGGVQAGDWAGVRFVGGQGGSRLSGVEFRYAGAGNPAGALVFENASLLLSNVTIRDSSWYPLSLDLRSNPQLEHLTLSDNFPADAVEVRPGALDSPGETVWPYWTDSGGQPLVRVVTGWLTVRENASLRLEPGLVLKFQQGAGLEAYGGLDAEQVTFTALNDNEIAAGSGSRTGGERIWEGIRLRGRKLHRLRDVTIRYAQIGIWMEDAIPSLESVRVEDCWLSAFSADLSSAPEFNGVQLAGNAINGLQIYPNSLGAGVIRWEILGSRDDQIVRVLDHPLAVEPSATLIVDPGVVVKFAQDAALVINGHFQVGENQGSPVVFTALADDEYGADTDGASQRPVRGAWEGITVNPGNTNARLTIASVLIRYANVGLHLTNMPSWEFGDVTIANSQAYGLSCDALTAYDPESAAITLIDNGAETGACPTPDR